MRPRLWLMSQRSDCRIFLTQSTLEVLETLCAEHRIRNYTLAGITRPPPKRDYVVQWNETDLAYLLRRLQEEGLFYWFRHERGKHTLAVGDHPSAYDGSQDTRIRLAFGSSDAEHIHDWRRQLSFTPGKRSGNDYEFLTPNLDLASDTPSIDRVPENTAYELYEYPARALTREAGERATRLRMQATETGFDRVEGRSSVRTLAAGSRFTPYEVAHPRHVYPAQVVTQILHRAEDPTYESGAGTPHYENAFTTLPANRPATPHRTVPRPRIDGLQIALIAGPPGEEIHTDAFGRIKLQFPWDRRARGDGTDTGWVRVTQSWGGRTWGHQVIPRVGMEALVAYQEGDPDRPIVIGIAPNPNNPVPYDLPAHKTRMVMRSNSYKSKGFNEMTFEDATGAENMFFHAQKDHTTKIENNQTHSVGADHANVVGRNQALTVGVNQTQEIGGSLHLTVGGTGAGAAALMGPLLGMAGQTAGLLGQAMDQGGGLAGLAAMAPQLAASVIGMLGQDGQQAQQGVWNGPSPRSDAGVALAAAGAGFGQAAGGLFSLPGMMNTLVGSLKTDSIGVARVEQVGSAKVTHVGAAFATQVGKAWSLSVGESAKTQVGRTQQVLVGEASEEQVGQTKMIDVGRMFEIQVGERFAITVGACRFVMDKSGTVTIEAPKTTLVKGGGAVLTVGPGPVLYTPDLVKGGGGSSSGQCLRRMSQAGTPFVRS
ncbi:fimbrial protein [Methylobacterium indicum]|uniref:Fimbrial protein n=1 Tax=Methylobacterium indicum TaxID=1775910 RepID=A0A8H9C884_9HYPH|nr:fimbrial protein [Methylobacterium indicum]